MYNKIILIFIIILIIFLFYQYKNNLQFNVWLMNRLIVSRGILSPNCKWYNISDILISDDSSGVKLYNRYKKKYGDFAECYMFNIKMYLVTNNNYIKTILDNSPDLFSVGEIKKSFFKSFMSKNVGVSTGCPWKSRRYMNEIALDTDKLHRYSKKFNNDAYNELLNIKDKKELDFNDFINYGKKMVSKIIFNTEDINEDIFKIFKEANNTIVFKYKDFKINEKIYNNYINILIQHIRNPNSKSLIELCLSVSNNEEEITHQIPHFIFPINGLYITTIPRLLLLLCNHHNEFQKVIEEINNINYNDYNISKQIYNLEYLRKCILETLRLNNPVITTFRSLTKDYSFDNKYSFKKGTQFVILNNPVLREDEYYKDPDKFIPSRWTKEMEQSYYAISFNQGPQQCPAKELSIFLAQSFIYNFIKIFNIGKSKMISCKKINTDKSPQIINPCKIKFDINDL